MEEQAVQAVGAVVEKSFVREMFVPTKEGIKNSLVKSGSLNVIIAGGAVALVGTALVKTVQWGYRKWLLPREIAATLKDGGREAAVNLILERGLARTEAYARQLLDEAEDTIRVKKIKETVIKTTKATKPLQVVDAEPVTE